MDKAAISGGQWVAWWRGRKIDRFYITDCLALRLSLRKEKDIYTVEIRRSGPIIVWIFRSYMPDTNYRLE